MHAPLLQDLVIIFILATIVLFLFHRFRIPAIVGFLLTGIVVGPHGLGLISSVADVEILAEIGVILLLFTIGIEFSLKGLLRIKRFLLIGGTLQGVLTYVTCFAIVRKLGLPLNESAFIGFLIALSSTTIVLKLLQERAENDSPHGRIGLAILIFQDIIVVPIMLVTPLLAKAEGISWYAIGILLVKGIGIILLVFLSSQWIVPKILFQITKTKNRELFLLSVLIICFAVAWLTSQAGLSLALGAFLAGLILSESEYSYQALSNILPFRDVFTSIFFVSIGMLLNLDFFFQHAQIILLLVAGVLTIKAIVAGLATLLMGFPLRTAILVGLSLSQVGEFAFVLALVGIEYNVLSQEIYQYFLALSIITMTITPFIIAMGPAIADIILRVPHPKKLQTGLFPIEPKGGGKKAVPLKDHLIIVGFGLNGRNVARAAKTANIPYNIIEMNPQTVRSEQARGEPIFYGDASQEIILKHGGIKAARLILIVISDPVATRRITELARRRNPKIHIIARTRYVEEMKPLYTLGANEVIPEEFETSVEIFTRVLTKYLIPKDEIEKFITEVRSDGYEMFRSISTKPETSCDWLPFPGFEVNSFRIKENSSVAGKTLEQTEMRKRYEVTLLAIYRGAEIVPNPSGETILYPMDMLLILGSPDKLAKVSDLFKAPT
jgi:CPA2 family monovalent cation:H+ antiporter-2